MFHFLAKLEALLQSPFEHTLFLDCDTCVLAPIAELFRLLERFDLALSPGPVIQSPKNAEDVIGLVPAAFPELNTGVMLYRKNERMIRFLNKWKTVFRDNENGLFRAHGQGGEQVSLRYLLWTTPEIQLHVLSSNGIPNPYNFRWPLGKSFVFDRNIKIHHHRTAGQQLSASLSDGLDFREPRRPVTFGGYDEAARYFDNYCRARGSGFRFIQIGANDGKSYDPISHRVRKHRWRGILVEPIEHLFQALQKTYADVPGLIFENKAIATFEGIASFYQFPESMTSSPSFPKWGAGMGSLLPPFGSPGHERLKSLGFEPDLIQVPCTTLTSLMQYHNFTDIDLLQIDAEGYDGEIICDIDFSSFRPRFIQFEDRHIDRVFQRGLGKVSSEHVKSHLAAAGYHVFSVENGFDQFCINVTTNGHD